jgi:hypothetical protein
VTRVETIYPFIEAEKLNSHIDQDGRNTAPGSVTHRGNVMRACELLEVSVPPTTSTVPCRPPGAAPGSVRTPN